LRYSQVIFDNLVRLLPDRERLAEMSSGTATAISHPNIAFIKYWGNRDNNLRLPTNGSISMNLSGLTTQTCVTFDPELRADTMALNGVLAGGKTLARLAAFLDVVRGLAGVTVFASVTTENNFPTGAGIASSASAYAAMALAASRAMGLNLVERDLSRLARLGSGSACRSIPGGFVEWQKGQNDSDSYAFSIAPPEYWALVDLVAVVQSERKPVGSSEGHTIAASSPLQNARLAGAERRLDACRQAILQRDFEALGQVVELDSNLMHAVMMTSTPPLFYWQPASLAIMKQVSQWRQKGLPVCYTLDAGPNVHVLCPESVSAQIRSMLLAMPDVRQVLRAAPGGPARLADDCTLT
jgi:diphosphomevalonate decarboxylase